MGKHSTAATRAARRSFYTSRPLVATGRILDRLRGAQSRLLGIALVLVFVVLGSITDFRTPLDSPCETEDSTMCYWDSNTRGKGQAQSYKSFTDQFRIYL
jgi:hypothetical protein